MRRARRAIITGFLVSAFAGIAAAQGDVIRDILVDIWNLLRAVVGGLAVVIIVIQGLKWIASAEDPPARKHAKQTIVHVIIGLIIVLLAVQIVSFVT